MNIKKAISVVAFSVVSLSVHAEWSTDYRHYPMYDSESFFAEKYAESMSDLVAGLMLRCDRDETGFRYVSLGFMINERAYPNFDPEKPFSLATRIDQNEIASWESEYYLQRTPHIALSNNFDGTSTKNQNLIDEMISGRTLHFRLQQGPISQLGSFDLIGFTAASRNLLNKCDALITQPIAQVPNGFDELWDDYIKNNSDAATPRTVEGPGI